jgi:sulfite oxidase
MTANPRLVHDADGRNSGVLTQATADEYITPTGQFFTRSHASIPSIDPLRWRLEIGGLVERPLRLSLDDLAGFPRHEVTATLVCAGLRRAELAAVGTLHGELPWGAEAASNGCWAGVALGEVLRAAGVIPAAQFVEFLGLDQVERDGHCFPFGASIDLDKALSDEVILATELNGEALPPAHGAPLRAIVPGFIGARSVKWLGQIVLSAAPTSNYFQTRAYRIQRTAAADDPRSVAGGVAITGVPLNAVITEPVSGPVPAGTVLMRGWAMGSAGRVITSVQVSGSAGRDWAPARIVAGGGPWTWVFWEAELTLPPGRHTLVVRASDGGNAAQPSELAEAWNVKGYSNNAWHRVTISVE